MEHFDHYHINDKLIPQNPPNEHFKNWQSAKFLPQAFRWFHGIQWYLKRDI